MSGTTRDRPTPPPARPPAVSRPYDRRPTRRKSSRRVPGRRRHSSSGTGLTRTPAPAAPSSSSIRPPAAASTSAAPPRAPARPPSSLPPPPSIASTPSSSPAAARSGSPPPRESPPPCTRPESATRASTPPIPIVPAAVIYDLGVGGTGWPDESAGREAYRATTELDFAVGNVGAGTGATAGAGPSGTKTGIGVSTLLDGDLRVSALVVPNPVGSILAEDGTVLAGQLHRGRPVPPEDVLRRIGDLHAGENTVIGCVVTNARLDKSGATKVAQMSHDGLARAVRPSHTNPGRRHPLLRVRRRRRRRSRPQPCRRSRRARRGRRDPRRRPRRLHRLRHPRRPCPDPLMSAPAVRPVIALLTDFGLADPYLGMMKGRHPRYLSPRRHHRPCPRHPTPVRPPGRVSPRRLPPFCAGGLHHGGRRRSGGRYRPASPRPPGRQPLARRTRQRPVLARPGMPGLPNPGAPTSSTVPNSGDPKSATPSTAAIYSPRWPPISPPVPTSPASPRVSFKFRCCPPLVPSSCPTEPGRLTIEHIDHFGNLVTNLAAFDVADPPDSLTFTVGAESAVGLASDYDSTDRLIALVGSLGYLEIAAPSGSAAAIAGANIGDPVIMSS